MQMRPPPVMNVQASTPHDPIRPGDSELRQRASTWSLDKIVQGVARVEASLERVLGRPSLAACMTSGRRMRLASLLVDLERAFLDAAQHSAWLETALMGEAGHQEMTGVLSEDDWQVLGAHRRDQMAAGLFIIQDGRKRIANAKDLLQSIDALLQETDLAKGA